MIKIRNRRLTHSIFAAASFLICSVGVQAVEVAFERDSSLPMVNLNVAIKAGSVADPAGKSGLTNFMAEMLMRGTRSHTKEQIDLLLDQMGALLQIETRAEAVIFRGTVIASQLEGFQALLYEILTQPSFPEAEIKKLKSEITSAILGEQGNDGALNSRRFARFLFGTHPYGNPVLGTIADVATFNPSVIQAQYNRIVRDPLLLVVGAGDTTHAHIENWAKTLGAKRMGSASQEVSWKASKPEDAASIRVQIVDKPERTQTQIDGGQVGVRMTDPKFFALYIGNYAFGGHSFTARLMTEIRVKRGWSYGANSVFRHGLQPRSWHFHLFPAAKDTPAALAYTLQMVRDLKEKGITSEEFEFAQRSLINGSGFMYNTPKKRVENKLLERTLDLPDGMMRSYGPALSFVTLRETNEALKSFLKPEQLAISIVGTAKDLKEPVAKAVGIPTEQIVVRPYTQE